MTNLVWSAIWLGQVVLVALAFGCLLVRFPRCLPRPDWARFLTGFSLAPLILGLWVIGLSYVVPGVSRLAFILGPIPPAVLLLAVFGRGAFRRLGKSLQSGISYWRKRTFLALSLIGLGLALLLLLQNMAWNVKLPISNADAIQYLSEAQYFSERRTPDSIIGYRGTADGSIRGDIHGFIFPAYLAQALMAAQDPIGYPNDFTARLAFQVTFFFMLTTTAALGAAIGIPAAAPLALILLLLVPDLHYISTGCNRDAFRIIPMVLLAVALLGVAPARPGRRPLAALGLVALLSGLTVSAHTLGAFAIPGLLLAWLSWGMTRRAKPLRMIPIIAAVCLGALAGGEQYISAYLETGSLRGSNVTADSILEDTVYAQGISKHYENRTTGANPEGRPLQNLVSRDGGVLSIGGALVAILSVLFLVPRWGVSLHPVIGVHFPRVGESFWNNGPWLGLTVLANALIFVGLFDFGPYRISEWTTVNPRYALHWYPFAAVLLGAFILFMSQREGRAGRYFSFTALAALLFFSTLSLRTLNAWPKSDPTWFSRELEPLSKAINSMPAGSVCLTEADYVYYYFRSPVLFLYTTRAKPLFAAEKMEEIDVFMSANNIGLVVIYPGFYMKLAGDQTPLARWLADPAHCRQVYDQGLLVIYRSASPFEH